MQLGRWVDECAVMPTGYGVAWRSVWSCRFYCLPIPLNVIAGWGRSLWMASYGRLKRGGWDYLETVRHHAESVAFQRGIDHGTERAFRMLKTLVEK